MGTVPVPSGALSRGALPAQAAGERRCLGSMPAPQGVFLTGVKMRLYTVLWGAGSAHL